MVFVPSRGFLFFYGAGYEPKLCQFEFSSPHGDFSFSMEIENVKRIKAVVFVPSRGFLFFYKHEKFEMIKVCIVFVPSRGFLFFYDTR